MANNALAAPAGRRRFWLTVLAFAIANVGAWVAYLAYDQSQRSASRLVLRVEHFEPGDQQTVSGHPTFSWTFNIDAAPTAAPDTQPVAEPVGAITPAVAGRWAWQDRRTLTFKPDADLPRATRFHLTLAPERIHAPGGFSLAAPFNTIVETTPLGLVSASQVGLDEGRLVIELRFNDAVLPADVLQHVSLVGPDAKPLGCMLHGESAGKIVRLRTDAMPNLRDGATVRVNLSAGLAGKSGPLALAEAVQETLKIGTDLTATDARASCEAQGDATIDLRFNNEIDLDSLRQVLSIEPALPFRLSQGYGGVRVSGAFQPATRYAIKIAGRINSEPSRRFPRAAVLSVFVPDRPAGVWFEHEDGYLGSTGNRTLMAHATNVTAVRATVTRVYDNTVVSWRNATGRSRWSDPSAYSRPLGSRRIELPHEKNKPLDIPISLDDLLPGGAPGDGVYRIGLTMEESDSGRARGPHDADDEEDFPYRSNTSAMVTLSDIGLSAKNARDGVTVWAVSLRTAEPLKGVRTRLFSDKGQLLATGVTDADGLARLTAFDVATGERPAVVLADRGDATPEPGLARQASDSPASRGLLATLTGLTWLDLRGEVGFGEADTTGRAYLRNGYEAFVYTDRGVYRPGEIVHLRAIVRGAELSTPPRFPVRWQFRRPDLRDWKSQLTDLDADGAAGVDLQLPDDLQTGRWSASVGLSGDTGPGKAFGSVTFQVEEFLPDRMKVAVAFDQAAAKGDATALNKPGTGGALERFRLGSGALSARVQADYLFGSPAAELPASLAVRIEPSAFQPQGWPGWSFGDMANVADVLGPAIPLGRRSELPVRTTDKKGAAQWVLDVPVLLQTGAVIDPAGHRSATKHDKAPGAKSPADASAYRGPWRLTVAGSVAENGGRAVNSAKQIEIDPVPYYVGVQRADSKIQPGKLAQFSVAWITPDGKPAAEDATTEVTLFRETWNNSLVHTGGQYRYESTRLLAPVGEVTTVTLHGGRGTAQVTPPDSGAYVLQVRDLKTQGLATCSFYASETAWEDCISRDNPEKLELIVMPAGKGAEAIQRLGGAIQAHDWRKVVAALAELQPPSEPELAAGKSSKEKAGIKFHPGEQAQVMVRSPFAGRLMLSVETDGVVSTRVLDMPKSQMILPVEITEACRPNAYVVATVIRPIDPNATWQAHRAVGATRIAVDNSDRRLTVQLSAPTEMRPSTTLSSTLHVTDTTGRPVAGAAVTVAAVDEGICLLTGFKSPDPYGFFTSNRALGVHLSDLYSQLMPEVAKPQKASEVGGDADAGDSRHSTPVVAKRVRPVALWAGVVHTDSKGIATANFNVPQFTGKLRLMAVAYAGRVADGKVQRVGVGSSEAAVQVRSPLLVQSSWPRFAAPGDRFMVPLLLFNHTPTAGEARVTVYLTDPKGGASNPLDFADIKSREISLKPVAIKPGGQATTHFEISAAQRVGVGRAWLVAEMNGETFEESIELPVRPAGPMLSDGGYATAGPDAPGRVTVPGGVVEGTGRFELRVTPWPSLNLPQGLDYLERYPYGCLEQTTSTCFPLAYLDDIGKQIAPGVFERTRVEDKIQSGITHLIGMQTAGGGLSMWSGGRDPWPWGSVYAAHFLVEVQKAGHAVPEDFRDHLLAYLGGLLKQSCDEGDPLEVQAYASYVLALAGKPDRAAMSRLSEVVNAKPVLPDDVVKANALLAARASARFQLAAAWLAAGRRDLAMGLVPQVLPAPRTGRQLGGNLGSPVRDRAVVLSTLLQVDPTRPELPAMAQELADAGRKGHWRSTQDTAFAVLALGRYLHQAAAVQPYATAELWRGDRRIASTSDGGALAWDAASVVPGIVNAGPLTDPMPSAKTELEVRVTGPAGAKAYVSWLQTGVPDHPPAPVDNDLQVRRRYLDREGQPLSAQSVHSGDLIQVELSVTSSGSMENIVIEDLLPAGLEIENPRLQTTAQGEDRRQNQLDVRNPFAATRLDVRDDRLVLVGYMSQAGTGKYVYLARAIAPGTFIVPPVRAECMYDLGTNSLWGGGTLKVVKNEPAGVADLND